MSKRLKNIRSASKKTVRKPRVEPSATWNLRWTPGVRESAKLFHDAFVKVCVSQEGSPFPPITTLTVRLTFAGPLQGSRAEELIRMIGAASEKNIEADALRTSRLHRRLEDLTAQAVEKQVLAPKGPEQLKWNALVDRINGATRSVDELGEPPYRNLENTSADSLPDFKTIWRERKRYTDRLPEFERVDRWLRAEFERLDEEKPAPPRFTGKLPPLEIESAGREVEISAHDLLGGPLSGWVCQIGDSASHTESLSKEPRWRELALAYCELHLKSGLLDYAPVGIEGGWENPFWDAARELLSQAQQHLLKFLKAACEVDSPPAAAEPVSKAETTEVKEPVANPPIQRHLVVLVKAVHEPDGTAPPATPAPKVREARARKRKAKARVTGKPDRKKVTIAYRGKTGTPLNVLVDDVQVRSNAVPTIKGLLAACILRKKHPRDQFLKTVDLKRLVLSGPEFEASSKEKAYPQLLDNLTRSLNHPHKIRLDFDQTKLRYRLPNVTFKTSLSTRVIEAALTKFKSENPIQRGKRKPSS